jgi:chromosomal replication initiation ATPase DnaA
MIDYRYDLSRPGQKAILTVSRQTGFTVAAIRSQSQARRLVDARRRIAVELRSLGYSYPRIGRILGHRHHTTIMYLIETAAPIPSPIDGIAYPDLSGEWAI